MFRIGEFAQIAQVSGRLLRYYDQLGLLSPVRIDPRFTPVTRPVFLYYRPQRYYGRLHAELAHLLERELRARLAAAAPTA